MSCFSAVNSWRKRALQLYFFTTLALVGKTTPLRQANLCCCQSLDIIALPWHNGSPGPVIFPLRLYLRYLEGFPSAPDFSRETSQTGMTMDFQWLIIMPLSRTISWASFALRRIQVLHMLHREGLFEQPRRPNHRVTFPGMSRTVI